jgi:hypothetical protein
MAFGQSSGPPATGKQVQELLTLLNEAGHIDFRDARGPMGFTQRQAAGKFTRDEADVFIAQLQGEAETSVRPPDGAADGQAPGGDAVAAPAPPVRPRTRPTSTSDSALRKIPTDQLAAELQRRGWVVMEP